MRRAVALFGTYRLFWFAMLGGIAAGILEILKHHAAAAWILAAVSLIAVFPLIGRMWRDIRSGSYGIDILAVTAVVASVLLRQEWAAIVVVIMLTGGESLEDFAARRANSELQDLLRREPQTAHVLRKRSIVDVAASSIAVRDTVIIKPGEVVPVDAVILEGSGSFDESSLTGESLPAAKQTGDQILSGSVNIDGAITARVLRAAADSQYQQIIRLVRSAAASPAPFVRLADRYSIPFTVVAYTIAGLAWILSRQPIRFLEVIIVATPCPLILAAPIALIAGMSRASRDGIIIKTGGALERLAAARTFAFDKTGTLTRGTPEADAVTAFAPYNRTDILAYAASLEQGSNHVLARAVTTAAEKQQIKVPKARHIREITGFGLEAQVGGKHITVGRAGLMQERGISAPRTFKPARISQTATFVAIDGTLAGCITFTDQLRPDAKATLRQLRDVFGVKRTLMVTGDNRAVAAIIGRQLGITDIHAEALPADKLRAIEALADRPVAFVGDGVNDAPVLTAADVGIALGARGSTAASEAADVVIMQDSLAQVARAVGIARRAFAIATQSIIAGISLSVILMLVFATGKFPPLYGAVVQEAVDVVVIFNALRAHGDGRRAP